MQAHDMCKLGKCSWSPGKRLMPWISKMIDHRVCLTDFFVSQVP